MEEAMEELERETAVGFFNVAHSYCMAAHAVHDSEVDCTHKALPAKFLTYHSAELYLKSFLLSKNVSASELSRRKFGHNLEALSDAATHHGLQLHRDYLDILKIITSENNAIEARYFARGFKKQIKMEALLATCHHLHCKTVEHVYSLYPNISRRPKLPEIDMTLLREIELPDIC